MEEGRIGTKTEIMMLYSHCITFNLDSETYKGDAVTIGM
jgi:hypothetical protein